MTTWHGYIAVQDLALTQAQRAAIWDQLQRLGLPADPSPARRCHWRASRDGAARIFEAAFDPDQLTIARTKERLGALFGVAPASIEHTTQTPTFGSIPTQVATFDYAGAPRFRLAALGTTAASWAQSRSEAAAFIGADRANWDEDA